MKTTIKFIAIILISVAASEVNSFYSQNDIANTEIIQEDIVVAQISALRIGHSFRLKKVISILKNVNENSGLLLKSNILNNHGMVRGKINLSKYDIESEMIGMFTAQN